MPGSAANSVLHTASWQPGGSWTVDPGFSGLGDFGFAIAHDPAAGSVERVIFGYGGPTSAVRPFAAAAFSDDVVVGAGQVGRGSFDVGPTGVRCLTWAREDGTTATAERVATAPAWELVAAGATINPQALLSSGANGCAMAAWIEAGRLRAAPYRDGIGWGAATDLGAISGGPSMETDASQTTTVVWNERIASGDVLRAATYRSGAWETATLTDATERLEVLPNGTARAASLAVSGDGSRTVAWSSGTGCALRAAPRRAGWRPRPCGPRWEQDRTSPTSPRPRGAAVRRA